MSRFVTYGYHCSGAVVCGLYLWGGVKRKLSAWAIGFEVFQRGGIVFFFGPLAFGAASVAKGGNHE